MTDSVPIRIVVADDSALFRGLLVDALRAAGADVLGEAHDLESTLALVEHVQPDVAVLDVRMPPTGTNEGIVAALAIRERVDGPGVLLLSQEVETATAADLIAGCDSKIGYLLKDRVANVTELVDAIRRIRSGGVVLDPEVVARLLGRQRRDNPLDRLTPTQRRVLGLVAEGQSNQGIADRMFISERTVETHVRVVFDALGLERVPSVHRRVLAAVTYLRETG